MPLDLALPPEASWHPNLSAEREILIRPDHLGHAVRFFSSLAVACGVGLSLAVISTWEAAGAQPGPIPGSHDNTEPVFSLLLYSLCAVESPDSGGLQLLLC